MLKKLVSMLFSSLLLSLLFISVSVSAEESPEIKNLSLNKPYTAVRIVSEKYPDTNNKELTDGILGTTSFYNTAWTACYYSDAEGGFKYNYWPLYSVTIDLQSVNSITEVKANFLRNYDSYIHIPRGIKVFASVDGENWMKLSYINNMYWNVPNGIYSYGWHVPDCNDTVTTDLTFNPNSSVKARYVRFDFEKSSGHHFIDEITVMGYEGVKSDAITPENTRKLEKDKIRLADESTGFIQDMVLIYNHNMWTKEMFKPYLTYVDQSGKSVDTLFDSVLFLSQRAEENNNALFDRENTVVRLSNWENYLDTVFNAENGDLKALNEAAKQASIDLMRPDYKVKFVIMIPYPPYSINNFGTLNNKVLDFTKEDDVKLAINWYCDEVIRNFENGDYEYIDFKGFYWMNEYPNRIPLITYTNEHIKSLGYKSYWIPYWNSLGYLWNETLKFDAITLQPSHFFADADENTLGAGGTTIINSVAKLGGYADFGVEMEINDAIIYDTESYNKGLDYLNATLESGFSGPGYFRNWYQGGNVISYMPGHKNPYVRRFYDDIYKVIKGGYQKREYIDNINANILQNKPYTHNGTNWYAERTTDTNSTFLTDTLIQGSFYGDNYFGVKNQDVLIDFDFNDNPITFKELHIKALEDKSAALYLPQAVKISYKPQKDSDEWVTLYDGDYNSLTTSFVLSSKNSIKAYGLKYEIKRTGGFLFLTELLAYDKNNTSYPDADITIDVPLEITNLSLGKPYTNIRVVDENHPDTDNKELTDGKFGDINCSNENWTGVHYEATESGMVCDFWPNYTTIIDLGGLKSVTEVSCNFLSNTAVLAYQPKSIRVFASEDGENWMLLSKLMSITTSPFNGIYNYGWHTVGNNGVAVDYTNDKNSIIKARYIRFDFEKSMGYQLIDEITVLGYDGVVEEALSLTNTTKLENDTIRKVGESTGNIEDMVLIYQNSTMKWPVEKFKPYLTYIDENGKSIDTLYDSVLFLALDSIYTSGQCFATENSSIKFSDWEWYLNRTFEGENADIKNLNEAARQASIDLNKPDYKVNLVVMIPFPPDSLTSFGPVDGKMLNLSRHNDAVFLIKWYCDKVLDYIDNGNYEYVDFKGFYWVNEYQDRGMIIQAANDYIREIGYKSYWIPYFYTKGYFLHELLGFDAMALQPNHFFSSANENSLGAGGTTIINTVAKLAAYDNFGVEMELDGRLETDTEFYNKGLDYLNATVESGFQGPGYFRNWYEGGGAIINFAYSKNPNVRQFYDDIYAMMNGNYKKREYITHINDNLLLNKPYTHNGANWYAERSTDSESVFLTDGEMGGSFYGDKYFGVKNQDVLIDFDFKDNPITFKQLHIQAYVEHTAALFLPENIKIFYTESEDSDNWIQIYNGPFSKEHIALTSANDITAYKLKFEFVTNGQFLFLKEILAYNKGTAVSDGVLFPTKNILFKEKYKTSVTNWYTSYGDAVDSDCTRLTDGKITNNFYNGSFFGALKEENPAVIEFNSDTAKSFKELRIKPMFNEDAGIFLPDNVKIEVKTLNSENYITIYNGAVTDTDFRLTSKEAISFTDLKFTFTTDNSFIFLSEIEGYSEAIFDTSDVDITPIMYGDVTSDKKVNRIDLLRLAKHFGGEDVEIDEKASDVNCDNKVSRIDLLRLAKYFGGGDVILGG